MYKRFLYIAVAMLAASCTSNVEFEESLNSSNVERPKTHNLGTISQTIRKAIYNETLDTWMTPQADPYSLANFQKAYDVLSNPKSQRNLPKECAVEFSTSRRLSPTHYALKIYPRNEAEQSQVERLSDVSVSYIPFNHIQLTQEEASEAIKLRSNATTTFTEKNPHTVTYDEQNVTDGGPTGLRTVQLPILYTVWPVDKPLPNDLEYVIDYEIFLPEASRTRLLSDKSMQLLEQNANSLAKGEDKQIRLPIGDGGAHLILFCQAYIYAYDKALMRNVPMANLKVRYQNGSDIQDRYSDNYGLVRFRIQVPSSEIDDPYQNTVNQLSSALSFMHIYQDYQKNIKWKIMEDETAAAAPIEFSKSVIFKKNANGEMVAEVVLPSNDRQTNEIHRAVNYFYNEQSAFEKKHYNTIGGTKIIAMKNKSNNGALGWFSLDSKDITIANSGNTQGQVIGTTLHELGHLEHFAENESQFRKTNMILIESFSSYVGWYLGEEYYKSLGWIHPGGDYRIAATARQTWTKNTTVPLLRYSPLFIDLTDNYNQSYDYPNTPNDNIKNVPSSTIWEIITSSQTWTQCRPQIERCAGGYPSFDDWISHFDYAFTR